jgi:hypothetical protein
MVQDSQTLLAELAAVQSGAAVYDRTAWGRIEVSDSDRLSFLHNQSTNDLKSRKPGEGCDTVFVNSTARTIDIATAYVTDEAVLLMVSPGMAEKLVKWFDRYIFFADKVKLVDLTEQTNAVSLLGPECDRIITQLGAAKLIGQPYGTHQQFEQIRIAVGNELGIAGYSLIANRAVDLTQMLATAGATILSDRAWQWLRIQQGRPLPGQELTDDYNALEAGLWQMVSFDKGCYIGQETIARLDTYNGVKQNLWGVKLDQWVEPGTPAKVGDDKVGILTSAITTDTGAIGLAYIRTKAGGAGLEVTFGDRVGQITALPFVTHTRQ